MNATLLVSAVVLASLWTATEWTAWKLGFQSELGHPWFELSGWTVYPAPAFLVAVRLRCYTRPIFVEGAYIAASGGIAFNAWFPRAASESSTPRRGRS